MQILDWNSLSSDERIAMLARPALTGSAERSEAVRKIIARVRAEGDAALRDYTARLDGVAIDEFLVSESEFVTAAESLPEADKAAIRAAHATLTRFHSETLRQAVRVETSPGIVCRRVVRAIPAVGLYVPGGTAPLPSTALMLGVPAQLAGNRDVVLCTPPGKDGKISAAILHAAETCGITRVMKLGGAQAIAAMAFGTETVPKVDRIFGPGNAWVTEAKQQVSLDAAGALFDLPAGPSEVLVIADADADPVTVAADLLSQAEHGPDSQVILLALSRELASATAGEVEAQLASLPRADIARQSLAQSRLIVVADRQQAVEISNAYAPEHLIINTSDAEDWLDDIENAGSVFLGAWTPESLGDYCSGTNHVLPTYGYARALGGLSVADFQKSFTVQSATAAGLAELGPVAIRLAQLEGLEGHARAVSLRLAERTSWKPLDMSGGVR